MSDRTTASVLASIWSEVLGISPIEPEDRFSELGGTSLLAESMLLRVRRLLGTSATAALLHDDPTLATLAERIEHQRRDRFRTPGSAAAVTLRDGTAPGAPTLHCFAGAGSSALAFLPLAATIDPDWAVHAYQQNGLESRGLPDWTVARAARRHARSVAKLQPYGPLHLAGHSYGGHVATEAARLLTEDGRAVAGLYLLDTLSQPREGESVGDMEQARDTVAPSLVRRLKAHLEVAAAGLVAHEPARHQSLLWEQAVRAQNRYRVRPLPPFATVFVTDQNAVQAARWGQLAPAEGQVVRLGADHNSILSDEHDLRAIVERVEQRAGLTAQRR